MMCSILSSSRYSGKLLGLFFIGLFRFSHDIYAQTWVETSILRAPVQAVNAKFGRSVAISGKYAAVGAEISGVFIFERGLDNDYKFVQELTTSNSGQTITGDALAMTDQFLVIGTSPAPGFGFGTAFIFERDESGTWQEIQEIGPSDPHGLDSFGRQVAINGNTIVVASPGKSIEYMEGAVYIFERKTSGEWIETQKMMSSDFQRDDHFGLSLAIQDDVLLVGSPYEDENTFDVFGNGAVYFFEKDLSGTWIEKQKIVAPERLPNAYFGYSLDVSHNNLIIGAYYENIAFGGAYFFERENDQWIFRKRFTVTSQESLGHDVAIEGNVAVASMGSHLATYAQTYVKDLSTGTWQEGVKIYGPPYFNYNAEYFGNAIDLFDGRLLVGAPAATDVTEPTYDYQTGEVHVYHVTQDLLPFESTNWVEGIRAKGSFPSLVDIDNDKDLDLFITYTDDNVRETRIYEFDNFNYEPIEQRFPALEYNSAMKWLDANGDGWMDFILRYEYNYKPRTELYLNNHDKSFTSVVISTQLLDDTWRGGLHFADYDNDADLDLLVQLNVEPGEADRVKVLSNNGRFEFSDIGLTFDGVIRGQPWADYNNDGFEDFVIIQKVSCDIYKLVALKNNSGQGFEIIQTNQNTLNDQYYNAGGDQVWADYNNDGFTDIIWSGTNGCSTGEGSSNIVINSGGQFRQEANSFRSLVNDVHLSVADFSNDGVMDLLTYGDPVTQKRETKFFLGANNKFEPILLYETPMSYQEGSAVLGDIDGDGDLDAVIAGDVAIFQSRIVVYKNNAAEGWTVKNQVPSTPTGLKVVASGKNASISWNSSTDDTTPMNALTYNIMLVRHDSILVSPSSLADGTRLTYQRGNAGAGLTYSFKNLKDGDYSVAIQAIDNGYAGSAFTANVAFTINQNILSAEEDLMTSIQLFPNPAQEELFVESKSELVEAILIYDLLGNAVITNENIMSNGSAISLSGLDKGIYIVTVQTNRGAVRRKIVKE